MSQSMDLIFEEVEQVVEKSCDVFLDLGVEHCEQSRCVGGTERRRVAGLAAMASEEGSLIVAAVAGEPLARRIAGRFFGDDDARLDREHLQESMAEMVNVFAGNMNALVISDLNVSTPVVVDGCDLGVVFAGRRELYRGHYAAGEELLEVRLMEGPSFESAA